MSPDTESTAGAPEYGDALVAALGFEPTDALTEADLETTLVAESADGAVSRLLEDAEAAAKTEVAGTPSAASNQAGSRKRKGKGPRTFTPGPSAVPAGHAGSGSTSAHDGAPITGPTPSVGQPANGNAKPVSGVDDTAPAAFALQETLHGDPSPALLNDAASSGVKPVIATDDFASHSPNGGSDRADAGEFRPVRLTPVAEGRGQPSGPPLGPPLLEQVVVQPGVALRQPTQAESVADRMSGLAAKVPQLLDGGLLHRSRRVRARKVRRVVRHIDPWSVLTFSVLFHLCVFAALLLSSVLVWNAAVAAGTIENIESFIRELGDYTTYEIKGDVVFKAAMVIAGILTLASSVLMVLLTVVFNLISDLVGGIRLTVVEEETVRVRRNRNQ